MTMIRSPAKSFIRISIAQVPVLLDKIFRHKYLNHSLLREQERKDKKNADVVPIRRRHVIISGTGRAGTTFLVQLFTALGIDTGFSDTQSGIDPNSNAGMEIDISSPDAPYIVKAPALCLDLDDVLSRGQTEIVHALVPMRDVFSAAESRRDVMRRSKSENNTQNVPGGLLLTSEPKQQEAILEHLLYNLMMTLVKHDIPVTLLHFPRMIVDAEYLFSKIDFLLTQNHISYEQFIEVHARISQPKLVHDFLDRKNKGNARPKSMAERDPLLRRA